MKKQGKEEGKTERQERMPLAERLAEYEKQNRSSFHVPGHKGNSIFPEYGGISGLFPSGMLKADLTEIDGFDDLHHPHGIIQDAQHLAADLFGADETFFLVNGTTSGIMAAVAAAASGGAPVLVCRGCHESVIRGLILGGASPVYIKETFDERQGIPSGITTESVRRALQECPQARALVIPHPSYYGTCSRLKEITELCHSFRTAVIADEAHGAQMYFSAQPGFYGALEAGCDISVQSTHKMLGSLTQSSMLHVKGDLIDRSRLRSLISFMNSTSPSYLLMASLDAVRCETALRGREIWPRIRELTAQTAEQIGKIRGMRCVTKYRDADGECREIEGCRLLISAEELGVTGYALYEILSERYGIDAEFADDLYVIAVTGSGTQKSDCEALSAALQDFSRKTERKAQERQKCGDTCAEPQYETDGMPKQTEYGQALRRRLNSYISLRHEGALSPRQAYFSPTERVALEEASGRISARSVALYPPGIPVLYPGEVISGEIRDYLISSLRDGCHIHGILREGGTFFLHAVVERSSTALFGMFF